LSSLLCVPSLRGMPVFFFFPPHLLFFSGRVGRSGPSFPLLTFLVVPGFPADRSIFQNGLRPSPFGWDFLDRELIASTCLCRMSLSSPPFVAIDVFSWSPLPRVVFEFPTLLVHLPFGQNFDDFVLWRLKNSLASQ